MSRFSRKKYIICSICAILTALVLGGCSSGRKTLSIGFDSEFPPYTYVDENGDFAGFDIELARAVCEIEGWELQLHAIAWDEKDVLLNSGEIDCIWSGFTINGREESYTLTQPYCENTCVVVVKSDSSITSLEDLASKAVGTQAASSCAEYLANDERGKALAKEFMLLSQFTTYDDAFESLEKGNLEVILIDAGIEKYYVEKAEGKFRILQEPLIEEKYGVALKKGNTKLCDILNKDLQKLSEDGTMMELAKKYQIEESVVIQSK